jgi:gluconate 2-dehydrogenase gamma chain
VTPANTPESFPLNPHQMATLAELVECIHPADDLGPGGKQLDIPEYVVGQLREALERFVPMYRQGILALDRFSEKIHGGTFVDLSAADRQSVLEALEAGPDLEADEAFLLQTFFELALEHTYEGLFGDPVYGGNNAGGGWELVGYPGPRATVSSRQQDLDFVPSAGAASTYELAPFRAQAVT